MSLLFYVGGQEIGFMRVQNRGNCGDDTVVELSGRARLFAGPFIVPYGLSGVVRLCP